VHLLTMAWRTGKPTRITSCDAGTTLYCTVQYIIVVLETVLYYPPQLTIAWRTWKPTRMTSWK